MKLKKHQRRMIKEYNQLRNRIDKLDKFLDEHGDKVDDEMFRLMRAQYFAMCAYEGTLRLRINVELAYLDRDPAF